MIKKRNRLGVILLAIILMFSCLPTTSAMAAHATGAIIDAEHAAEQTAGPAELQQTLTGDGIVGVSGISAEQPDLYVGHAIVSSKWKQTLTFTVQVIYRGATDLENVPVTYTLANGLEYVSSNLEEKSIPGSQTGQAVSWTVTFPGNSAEELTLTFTIKAKATITGELENTFSIEGKGEYKQTFTVTPFTCTVNYLEEGTNTVVAPSETIENLGFEDRVTRAAIEVNGYNKKEPTSQTITIGANEEENVINFYYTKRTDLRYTVRYVETGTQPEHELRTPDVVENQTFASVIQASDRAVTIPGYEFDAANTVSSITVGTGENVLTLYYKKADFDYTVFYRDKETNAEIHAKKTASAKYLSEIKPSDEQIDIIGHRYVSADPAPFVIGTNPDSNVLTLFYTKESFNYTIRCLEDKTGRLLKEETGRALYQSQIKASDVLPAIEGFAFAEDGNKSFTIGADETANILTLRYERKSYPYTIQYLDEDTGELLQLEAGTAPYQSQLGGKDQQIPIKGYDFSETPGLQIGTDPAKNVLTMQYAKASFAYTVLYLDKNTNVPVHTLKTDTAKYKTQVRAASQRIAINEYQYDSASAPGITIGTDTTKNVLTLYYVKKNTPPRSPYFNYTDHMAYINGYPDGTLAPNQNITRNESAVIFYRLLTEAHKNQIAATTSPFPDVIRSSATEWYFTAVVSMANGQYIKGYPDGTFGGDRNITRAEFVTILMRFFPNASGTGTFPDVSADHFAYHHIAAATSYGWIKGYQQDDGSFIFQPEKEISRAEAVTILNRVLERGIDEHSLRPDGVKNFSDNENPDAWFYYEIIEAANAHEYEGARPSEDWTKLL